MNKNPLSYIWVALLLLATVSLSPALNVTARYFRFTQTQLRDPVSANSIQLSEFDMLFQGGRLAGATASNPGGNNPQTETPNLVVDGNTATKWLDFNKLGLVLDFGAPVTADGYRFATANDGTERDPLSWTLESSDDGTTWNPVETKTNYPTPLARKTYTPNILFQSDLPLTILNFSTDRPKIGTGQSAILTWEVVGSSSVTIDHGIGVVSETGTSTITPSADTTYTLTATKGAETLTQQATVRIINAGSHTYQFFRFSPVALRAATANSIQLSEFQVLKDGVPVPGVIATNPGGSNATGETPDLAVDGDTATKWLDFTKSPLLLTFPAPVEINGYRFATANDFDERDPVDWTLEGSADGTSWIQLDSVTGFPVPRARLTYIGIVPLPAVLAPAIPSFVADPVHLQAGGSTTLTWSTDFADTVAITPAVPNGTSLNGSATVTPAASATWTLTATNATGSTSRTVRVQVEGPAQQVTWKFFRFTPTVLRDPGTANSVQISEFELSLGGQPVSGATASNPGGDNPATELPGFAVDGSTGTKWLDFNKGPLVLEFPAAVTIDAYRFATGDDAPERDPVTWTFEGSADGLTWSPIDSRDIGFVVPAGRSTYTNYFHFTGTAPGKTLVPVAQLAYDSADKALSITWNSEPGRTYRVERSTNLESWETAVDNVASTGAMTSQTLVVNGDKVFFQIVLKP